MVARFATIPAALVEAALVSASPAEVDPSSTVLRRAWASAAVLNDTSAGVSTTAYKRARMLAVSSGVIAVMSYVACRLVRALARIVKELLSSTSLRRPRVDTIVAAALRVDLMNCLEASEFPSFKASLTNVSESAVN